jgi:hypothetical protein
LTPNGRLEKRTSLIKAFFFLFVGATGRGLADLPAPFPDHPHRDMSDRQSNLVCLRYLCTAPIRVSLTTESANPTSVDLSRRITCTGPAP